MKRILLINYYWPPCGGSAVQRWLDLSAYFQQLNIATDVITIDDAIATFPFRDEQLNDRIASETRVFRTDSSELFYLYDNLFKKNRVKSDQSNIDIASNSFGQKLARFVRGNFLLPDPRRGWNKHAIAKATELLRTQDYEAVFTAGPPQSSHLIGLALKRRFPNIKWVADFHDYWIGHFNLKQFYRTAIANFIDARYEQRVLKEADSVMTHCRSSKQLLASKLNADNSKLVVHTMGYNPDLFADRSYKFHKQETFTIVYTGILADTYAPNVVLDVVAEVQKEHTDVRIQMIFAGSVTDQFLQYAAQNGLAEQVEFKGYIPQQESVALIKSASILLLINPNYPENKIIVPGKIYEYLAAEKPIWSISSSNSENETLIQELQAGQNFDWSAKQKMQQFLSEQIKNWQHKGTLDLPENAEVKQYSRDIEAAALLHKLGIKA